MRVEVTRLGQVPEQALGKLLLLAVDPAVIVSLLSPYGASAQARQVHKKNRYVCRGLKIIRRISVALHWPLGGTDGQRFDTRGDAVEWRVGVGNDVRNLHGSQCVNET